MEKLSHIHAYPNCPACEQAGQWKAEAKLQAAAEMARALKALHDFPGWYTADDGLNSDQADAAYNATVDARIAWEKAGKEVS